MFGSFLSPSPHLLFYPANLSLPGRNYFALISSFVEERVKGIIGSTKGFC
jgi:hypothetical protein